MDLEDPAAVLVCQEIVKNHLRVAAIIQDIQKCTGPLELLHDLNTEGREKIVDLRQSIDRLSALAETATDEKKKASLLAKVESHKGQLSIALAAFRKANIVSACVIDKLAKDELTFLPEEHQNAVRKRRDKKHLTETSNKVTDRLLSISRHLAETTQRSADTLDTLVTSSEKVTSTKDELEHQQQAIIQSGKLLGKYGRREVTDKALLVLAFAFFLACVFYILQKRLW
ncbi:vesicle transport protein SEC20 [Venturia canescens]|uniref:vesicle transport protein SEC20 n=1 Tax=Venturia canescens TaxID=32260 RepID=UPI001C9C4C8D|nr:vesicle transport protein SEC20 [Venturia canescens]